MTQDVVFSRFLCVTFTTTLRQQPKEVMYSRRRKKTERESTPTTFNSFGLRPQGYCERNTHES